MPCFLSNGNANGKGPKQNLMTWIRKNTSHHLEERERNARAQDNPQGILQLRAEDLSRLQTDLFLLELMYETDVIFLLYKLIYVIPRATGGDTDRNELFS